MITVDQIREKAADIRKMGAASFEASWLDDIADRLEELEDLFDLRLFADMRAVKLWQAAHPGNEKIWPDHAELVVWLLNELKAASSAAADPTGA